jgi:SAM-dependent methyltransferase/uncharacterized protein YbaR (Trm112 family)
MRENAALMNLMRCPTCDGSLALGSVDERADEHIMKGTLVCQGCQQTVPIVRGVPRFVAGVYNEAVRSTVSGFGFQWTTSANVLSDNLFAAPETFLGFISPPVMPDYFQGKTVLDAGCGAGRNVRAAAQFGAQYVVGLDLSDAVDVAFESTRQLPNVLIIQADILKMPLCPAFDYAFSVGVLHHTDDPRRAFGSVSRMVVPGGGVSAWVYGCENNGWIIHGLNPIRERITSRLPRRVLLALAYLLAVPMFLALKLVYRPVGKIAALRGLKKVLFYFDYLYFLGQFDFHTIAYVIFDHLVPELAAYICRDEFEDWFAENHLEQVAITSRAGNSWRGFAQRPATETA